MTHCELAVAADHDGSLGAATLARIGDVLLGGGFVLLPSDTSYSIAALPLTPSTREQLTILLDRPDQPVSLAFPHMAAVNRWTAPNPVTTALLERFCPGPITVVTRCSSEVPAQVVNRVLGKNGMIGVRIPSSATERATAAAVHYPVTTTAVIDPTTSQPLRSYREARDYVESRVGQTTFPGWCAIEGAIAHAELSTVVRVTLDGRLQLVRPGAIGLHEIEACRNLALQEQR